MSNRTCISCYALQLLIAYCIRCKDEWDAVEFLMPWFLYSCPDIGSTAIGKYVHTYILNTFSELSWQFSRCSVTLSIELTVYVMFVNFLVVVVLADSK